MDMLIDLLNDGKSWMAVHPKTLWCSGVLTGIMLKIVTDPKNIAKMIYSLTGKIPEKYRKPFRNWLDHLSGEMDSLHVNPDEEKVVAGKKVFVKGGIVKNKN